MNQLSVNLQHSIPVLAAKGWSARKIARELAVNRETVGRYLRLRAGPGSKPATAVPQDFWLRGEKCAGLRCVDLPQGRP